MRVLVTGACGFIGHHVVEAMARLGHDVIALDRLDQTSTQERLAFVCGMYPNVRVIWHDLKSPINELVSTLIGHVDAIFHLAASTHVDRSIQNSMPFVMDNVVGTANLLEYARTLPDLILFLNFSTDEVFGPARDDVWYREEDRYDPRNPYSATKAAAVEIAHAYANTYEIPVITTHCMNVYGERQHPEKFIPLVIGSVLAGKTVPIHVDKKNHRPGGRFYIYVGTVATILVEIFDGLVSSRWGDFWKPPSKLNIPGEREVDNLLMAQLIAKHVGRPLKYDLVDFHSTRPGHDLRYALDGYRLSAHLNLKIPPNFDETLQRTVDWYLDNREWLLT